MAQTPDISNDLATDIWVRLSRAHMKVQASIEAALKAAGLPSLAWYDALRELERFGPEGGRAFEVQARLLLPQYGLSRLLGKLEKAGYLVRKNCAEDGRGKRLVITDQGKRVRRKMWRVYRAALKRAVGDKLPENDGPLLLALLERLK